MEQLKIALQDLLSPFDFHVILIIIDGLLKVFLIASLSVEYLSFRL